MKNFDVAVIGLGAVGSAALYQLSKTGLSVVGIDKYAPPHSHGSSFGESRVTRQAIGEGAFYTPIVLRANQIWTGLEQLTGEELYNRCGMLITAPQQHNFLKNTVQAARDFKIEHRLLDGGEVEQLFPAIRAAQTDHAFYYEPAGGFLRPEKCVETQLKIARDNGATTLLHTTVASIEERPQGVQIQLQNGQIIQVGKLVVTSGPWIKDMLPNVLAPILKTYLQTHYWFDIDRAHYDELAPGKMPVFLCGDERTAATRSFYGFPALAGAAGGVKFAVHESELQANPDNKDTATPATSAGEVYRLASRYINHIQPDMLRSANCLYTKTPDENFILDFAPGSERIIIGSACSGHGFKHSAATGEILAQLAVGGETTLDISEFKIGRFI